MKKLLVIGANGMAGHIIKRYLETLNTYIIYGIARNKKVNDESILCLDIEDTEGLESIFKHHKFDIVINCIGILNKNAEDNPAEAIWFNAYFPHWLAQNGKNYEYKLIHISTDCVFSGKGKGSYVESDFKDGIGYYAQSKALGEVINVTDLTIRTSIIGPELKMEGIGLFHWFMSRPEGEQLNGFSRAYWTGVTTLELAKAIDAAIKQNISGLRHLVYHDKISKLDLLLLLNKYFRQSRIDIIANENYTVDKSLVNTKSDFNYNVPNYEQMIKELQEWIETNKLDYYDFYSKNT